MDMLRSPRISQIRGDLEAYAERAIFTLRRPDEGGGFKGSEPERLALVSESAGLEPAYFDIELRTLKANRELARTRLGQRTIVSWHGLAGTPDRARLLSLMADASAFGLPKIVPAARSSVDNLAVLSLYDRPGPPPIAFCMGQPGLLSRVMAIERGTPIAYASLDGERTAEGQLSLGQALAIRRRLESA